MVASLLDASRRAEKRLIEPMDYADFAQEPGALQACFQD
jgi:hypothetical protein